VSSGDGDVAATLAAAMTVAAETMEKRSMG
jgi:hypothetical protein